MFQHLSSAPKLALKDRLWFRLGLLFCAAFITVFVGGLVYELFQSLIEQQSEDASIAAQPTVVAIDPKIESELTKVLSLEPVEQNMAAVKDPFTDRSGISNNTPVVITNAAPQPQTTAMGTTPVRAAANNFQPRQYPSQTTTTDNTPSVSIASPEATISRMQLRQQRLNSGQDVEPESSVFAIEDLHPVGIVSGGDEQQEVMFYSQALNKTFSFPVGSRFFDGVLIELKPEGVEFSYMDAARTLQLKPWEHSLTPKTTGSVSLESSPNLAFQSKEN